MKDAASYFPLIILLALGVLRCLRIYSRTSLNAEMVKAAGLLIMIASFSIGGVVLPITGFIIFNIGYIMAVTFENAFRKELFSQITLTEKLLGDVPKFKYAKNITTAYKYNRTVGLITGGCCVLMGLFYFKRLTKYEITDILFPGMLFFAGIFFVVFSALQKTRK
jgi:hypothetical protein